jgi:hypothetical protein
MSLVAHYHTIRSSSHPQTSVLRSRGALLGFCQFKAENWNRSHKTKLPKGYVSFVSPNSGKRVFYGFFSSRMSNDTSHYLNLHKGLGEALWTAGIPTRLMTHFVPLF